MIESIADLGLVEDEDISLGNAALRLAALDHPGVDIAASEAVIERLADEVAAASARTDTTVRRAAALRTILADKHDYRGDSDTYDADVNADLISVLVQQWLNLRAYDLSLWILNHQKLSALQLTTLQNIFHNRESTNWIDRAVIGDRCSTLASFDYSADRFADTITDGRTQRSDVLAIRLFRLFGQLKKDEITYLTRMDEAREAARLPFPENLDRANELSIAIKNEAQSKMLFVTGSLLPGFLRSISRNTQHAARLRILRAALAIEQYRIQHGFLPQSLDDLKPDDATSLLDPFSGVQLHYTGTNGSYTLYSIGPDQEDDGGKTSVPLYSKEEIPLGDFTASVRR